MKLLFVDGSAGASGDMLLGALVHLGISVAGLRRGLQSLPVDGWTLRSRRIVRCALTGRRIDVKLSRTVSGNATHGRGWKEIRRIVRAADLPIRAQERSLAVFRRLLEAEAIVHGKTADTVHLHEAGGVDAIVDVVGTCLALEQLNVAQLVVSPLTTGFGRVACAHGDYPIPAPATLELCRGVPVTAGPIQAERLTPTGAALLTTLADRWGEMPAMIPRKIGYGAGSRDLSPHPNMLRVVLGDAAVGSSPEASLQGEEREVRILECQLDDATAEEIAFAAETLMNQGALDVLRTAVAMKKGRLGTAMTVIARPEDAGRLARGLFDYTSTLGVRMRTESRLELERASRRVSTAFGRVRVKFAPARNGEFKWAPEYEDCKKLALRHDVSIRKIQQAALQVLVTEKPTNRGR